MVYGRRPLGFTAPYSTSTSAFPVSVPPSPAQMTAVTFGWSIQGSRMIGPTEFTTTIVLLFCAATARTSASPLRHAVKFFLWGGRWHVEFLTWNEGRAVTCLSPSLPSTVMYSSPESDCKKTIAASCCMAAEPAPTRLKSLKTQEKEVWSLRARACSASYGYSTVHDQRDLSREKTGSCETRTEIRYVNLAVLRGL